jgi:hypothetical protein
MEYLCENENKILNIVLKIFKLKTTRKSNKKPTVSVDLARKKHLC